MSAFRKLASLAALISLVVAAPHMAVAQDGERAQFSIDGLFPIGLTRVDTPPLIVATNTVVATLIAEQRKTTLHATHALEWRLRANMPAYKDEGPLWNWTGAAPLRGLESTPAGPCRVCDIAQYMAEYHYRQKHDRSLPNM